MILKKASYKAIKYACLKFHYAKSVPVNVFGYSVFNKKKEWCGVILYGRGANNNLAKSFNQPQGSIIELVRMALNGKQESTSKAMSISIKILKKYVPLAKLIVSYSDMKQNHKGIIYQACNFFYVGSIIAESAIDPEDGKVKHTRILHSKYGSIKGFKRVKDKPKHKYLYPLTKDMRVLCNNIKKEYVK
tara:strand:+ start:218 stop:784 length:567 start_codon:yes stop_codon:yes gene_type:complete